MKLIPIISLLLLSLNLYAQKIITVSGECIYYPPDTESYEISKAKALQRAQIQILADTFGTVLNAGTATVVSSGSNGSGIESFSIGESLVKGEWLETTGEPEFVRILDSNDMLAIRVRIKGKVREISPSSVDYDARILRNGTEDRFESTDFKDGDELFLAFRAPVDGYLSVYLYDGGNAAYCLLPYLSMNQGAYHVKGGERYVLFSSDEAKSPLKPYDVDEFSLTSEREMELNRIYCIFSPNQFVKATDSRAASEALPREVKYQEFMKWLARVRTYDLEMRVKTFDITIKK